MDYRHTILKIRSRIRSANLRLAKNSAAPRNTDRSLWGSLAVFSFASVTGLNGDVQTDPETVLADLLADLMHWCDVQKADKCLVESIDFESALRRARHHYSNERAEERGQEGPMTPHSTIVPI